MNLLGYRRVLAIPRVGTTMLFMFLARLPTTFMGLALTLHMVNDLGRGYAEAGLAGTATTLGTALGAPLMGRMIDRHGMRPVVAVCGFFAVLFWSLIPYLPYGAVLVLALPAGMLVVPMGSLNRQFLTSLVPSDLRRTAFSLDVILGELSFIIGPAAGIVLITHFSAAVVLTGIGVWRGLASVVLYVVNWPTVEAAEVSAGGPRHRPPLRSWLSGPLVGALATVVGAMFVLGGTELAAVAALRAHHALGWTGVLMGVMSAASIAGGLVHGAVKKSWSQGTMALLLGLLLVPVGLFDHNWWLLSLALIPMNLLCTPTLAASSEAVAELAPPQARGEAMGLQDAANRLGMALGSPVVGFAVDRGSPAWGFAAAGLGGVLLAGLGFLTHLRPLSSRWSGDRSAVDLIDDVVPQSEHDPVRKA